jgi:hypothetical protein
MPREGPSAGFDPVPVCAFCIENLTSTPLFLVLRLFGKCFDQEGWSVTAGGRAYLRNISLARLKKYVDAYNIGADGVIEKDDLIQRIIAVRVSVSSYRPFLFVDFVIRIMGACHTQTRCEHVFVLLVYSVCSHSTCRPSTGGTLSPMAGLVDHVDCSQGVRGRHLYNPPHDNLPVIRRPVSPVQISIRLDRRDRLLGSNEDRLPTLPHVQLRLRWLLIEPIQPLRLTYRTRSLAPRRLMARDRAPGPVMATRLIQQPVQYQPLLQYLLHPLWTNCWL